MHAALQHNRQRRHGRGRDDHVVESPSLSLLWEELKHPMSIAALQGVLMQHREDPAAALAQLRGEN